jgi:hypothetical protein
MKDLPFSLYDFFAYFASGLVVCLAWDHSFNREAIIRSNPSALQIVAIAVIAYIIGHIAAYVSGVWIEQYFLRGWLGRTSLTMVADKPPVGRGALLLRRLFKFHFYPMPEDTRTRLIAAAERDGVPHSGLAAHAQMIARADPITSARVAIFLNLYGTCRNLIIALFAAAVILTFGAIWPPFAWTGHDHSDLVLAAFTLIAAYVFIFRYLYFLRLYDMEAYAAYANAQPRGCSSATLESERRWDDLFLRSQELLARMAEEAHQEYRAGLTEPLDPEKL